MTTDSSSSRMRLLLVETEHDFFARVSLLLEEAAPRQYILEWASTYGFALTILRRQPFALCLVSAQVGHRRGTDMVMHIKANFPGTPVILLAGSEELPDAPAAQPLDCLDRNRLSTEMLRQAIREAVFHSAIGVPVIPNLVKTAAADYSRVAA